jgi:hypothetical protein
MFTAKAKYAHATPTRDWEFLHSVATGYGASSTVQHEILWALGLGYLGFIDADIAEILTSVPPDEDISEARMQIETAVSSLIPKQVVEKGITVGLDLDRATKFPEIALLTKKILNLRRDEMKRVRVFKDTFPWPRVNLKPMWLTHYGLSILASLGMSNETNEEGLKKIEAALTALGIEIQVYEADSGKRHTMPVRMSMDLKGTIWWMASHGAHELP